MVNLVHPLNLKQFSLAKGWADKRAVKEVLMEDVCDKRQAEVPPFTTVSLRTPSSFICCEYMCVSKEVSAFQRQGNHTCIRKNILNYGAVSK